MITNDIKTPQPAQKQSILMQSDGYRALCNLSKHHANKAMRDARPKSKIVRKVAHGRLRFLDAVLRAA